MFRCLQTLNGLGLDQFSVQGLMGALALGSLGLAPGAPELRQNGSVVFRCTPRLD